MSCRTLLMVALVGLIAVMASPGAAQQEPPPSPATVAGETSTSELESLVRTLEDPAERKAFIEKLDALIAARREGAGDAAPADARGSLGGQILRAVSERMRDVTRELDLAADAARGVPDAVAGIVAALTEPETRERWLVALVKVLAVLFAGIAAERVLRWLLARPRRRLATKSRGGLPLRAVLILGRAVLDAVPIAAFAAAAYVVMAFVGPNEVISLVAVALVNAILLSLAVSLVGRALLAPATPVLRLPGLSDQSAEYLFGWLRGLARTGIYGYFGLQALGALGLNVGAYAVLLKLLGLLIAGQVIVFILQNRATVAVWLGAKDRATGQVASLRHRLADLWHLLAIVYVLASYAVWALEIRGGFPFIVKATVLTLAVIIGARALHAGFSRIYARGIHFAPDLDRSYPGLAGRLNRYMPVAQRVTDWALVLVAALLVLQAWEAGVIAFFRSGIGARLVSIVVTLAVVGVVALLVWEGVNSLLDRLEKRAKREAAAPKRSARVQTLLPLLRNAFRIVLITIAGLIALSEVGVDIGPLLAGAGVIGLAIGFGSQTLVKDVITGVFILAEDSLAIGDWVEAGGHMGEVENLTIRTITLRDLEGQVHVVPFSEVTSILNMSRDYGHAVIDVKIAYREDTDEVSAMLEEVAREMRADPDWGPRIMGDLEIFGVNDLGESAVIVRVRLMTAPVMQWGVRREFLRRTKKLFDRREVEIPFPHRTLYFGEDKEGQAAPARVAMQAAPVVDGEPAGTAPEPTQTTSMAPKGE